MPALRVIDREGIRSSITLEEGRRYLIGRSRESDLVLTDPVLSRLHAELYQDEGRWSLRDRGSSNGTFVNGRRLDQVVPLEPGDRIELGGCRLEYAADAGPAEGVTVLEQPLPASGTIVLSREQASAEMEITGDDPDAARRAVAALRKRLGVIEKATLELLSHERLDRLLPKIVDLVFDAVRPDRAAILSREEEGGLRCRALRSRDSAEITISRSVARKVLDEHASILTADAATDADLAAGESVLGVGALMAVPLRSRDEVIGLLYADSRTGAHRFGKEDLKLLTVLANVAAIQMENALLFEEQLEKQRFEREARAAADIQKRLLPRETPRIPGYRFQACNAPCHEVGGDYYDCLPLGDSRWGIVLADVAGKGMGAALLMAVLQATYHARAEAGASARELSGQLNQAIARRSPANRFVTLFFAELDHETHRFLWLNAGHAPPPLLVRASGEVQDLPAGGLPLGVLPEFPYPVAEGRLDPGDFLFACSDGVTDVANGEDELFGEERLAELLASLRGQPPAEVASELERRLREHGGGAPRPDDLTYLIVQREP